MSNTVHLSDVQLLNLSVLMTIQVSVKKDPVTTCFKFNLSADEAARIDGLRQEQLQAIVANRGHESLFKLREDFWDLLDIPPGLQGTLSRVRLAEIHATCDLAEITAMAEGDTIIRLDQGGIHARILAKES